MIEHPNVHIAVFEHCKGKSTYILTTKDIQGVFNLGKAYGIALAEAGKAEKEKRKKESEKYMNFETYGTYGPRERVLPLALNFFGARGETLTEVVGDEKVNGLFDTIKGIKFR